MSSSKYVVQGEDDGPIGVGGLTTSPRTQAWTDSAAAKTSARGRPNSASGGGGGIELTSTRTDERPSAPPVDTLNSAVGRTPSPNAVSPDEQQPLTNHTDPSSSSSPPPPLTATAIPSPLQLRIDSIGGPTSRRSLQPSGNSEPMTSSLAPLSIVSTPPLGSLMSPPTATSARPHSVSIGGGGGSGGVMPKPSTNKSKLLALTGESLPTNALDPTGYEQHDEDAKKTKSRENDEILAEAAREGLLELDAFGKPIYKNFRSRVRVEVRKKARGCWKVRDPASPGRQYWSLIAVTLLMYNMVEIPIRIGFGLDVVAWSAADLFNLFVDCWFLVDVVINFRTGYYQEDNRLVLDEKKVAVQYLKTWFALDFITSVPISQLVQAAVIDSPRGVTVLALPRVFRIFRIARLFKILRMLKLMNVMSSWSESSNERIFSLVIKVLKFITLIFLLSHFSGCIWGYIAIQQRDGDGNFHYLSWPYRYGIYNWNDTTFSHMYILSFYWALCTLTTVGYGDIHAGSSYEYAFCIALTFVGTCMFGYIIGTMASILKHGKEAEALYLDKMKELNLYMSYRKISPYLQKKVRKHYEFMWKHQTLYNETDILNELPTHLRSALAVYLYKDLIAKVPFLADMGPDCSLLVILKLKPLQFMPGGFIFTKGALGREMFFVSKGRVEVINGEGLILCQLQEGSYFGEYAILSEKPVYRTASIRARTVVDLLSLSKNDFEMIWGLYPEIYAKIILRAKEQWQQAIAENQTELVGDTKLSAPAAASASDDDADTMMTPVKKNTLALPAGDTVIRIEKSEDVGSERRLTAARSATLAQVAEAGDDNTNGDADEVDPADDGLGDDGDLLFDYADEEPSYIDSLAGLESENDELFDTRRDCIDLPDHLLPPPKPRIIGSLVAQDVDAANAAALADAPRKSSRSTAGRMIRSLFSQESKPTSIKKQRTRHTLLRRMSNELSRSESRPTTSTNGSTTRPQPDLRRRSSGTSLSPMLEAAILSPAGERQMMRRKSVMGASAMELTTMARALHESTTTTGHDPAHAFVPGSPAHRAKFMTANGDGLNRGSVFSNLLANAQSNATVAQAPSGGLTADTIHEGAETGDEHSTNDRDEDANATAVPTAAAQKSRAFHFQPESTPAPAPSTAGGTPSQPQLTLPITDLSSVDSSFWSSLESLVSQSLHPLQSQYRSLQSSHAALVEQHARTEAMLRTVAAALQQERAAHAAASADKDQRGATTNESTAQAVPSN